MDFVRDQLGNGRPFRVRTVMDPWNPEGSSPEPGFSFSGQAVADASERRIRCEGLPLSITVGHGTESTSRTLEDWAFQRGVKLDLTLLGRSTESGRIENVNGRPRDEWLNVHQLLSIEDARAKSEAWGLNYNRHRAHSALGHLTPTEYA